MFGIGTVPSQYYIALTLGEPRGADTGLSVMLMEPQGGAYTRKLYGTGPSWWLLDGTTLSNTADVTFPTPSAPWGYVTHFALCSTAIAGDLFAWGALQNPQMIKQDVPARLIAGAMVLSMPVSP